MSRRTRDDIAGATPTLTERGLEPRLFDVAGRVLVVDDDQEIRAVLCDLISEEGFEVDVAANGAAALRTLQEGGATCLILLDLMMPVMDGITFRREQMADRRIADIPVVVITAGGGPGLAGTELIRKPMDAELVMVAVRRHCSAASASGKTESEEGPRSLDGG